LNPFKLSLENFSDVSYTYVDVSVYFQNYKIYVNGFIERLLKIKCNLYSNLSVLHDISFAMHMQRFFLSHGRFNNRFS